ncbi:E3 ubiquitin-protein ligase Topors-like isoform X2 [Nerophis ophidion]|uniref:E3 ubiquitin-protein ligase Topors-like isoform X2 n=1 Tax=Nerophis ophidion TaxID=159077 RepID=UPI002AE04DEE|nr:E3 ubiquitin-protein ligase Topors-like isoform X2 [Nerophis ophidion]
MSPTSMKLRVRRSDTKRDTNNGGEGEQQQEEVRSRASGSGNRRAKKTKNTRSGQTTTSSPPAASSSSVSARAALASEDASPDSKCPICLDRFNNMAYLDRCLHRFCFPCIQEWSHNKAECPLCKQPFKSILHSVRAHDDFKEYTLRAAPPSSSVAATVAMVAAMASAARNDQQMRLLLRRHRVADGTETTARRRRREEERGVWEWYLDVPPLSVPPHDEYADDEQHLRGAANLAEHGVIFEGLGGPGAGTAPNDSASRRLMTRLSARLRLQQEGGVLRRLREREAVAFRRALYRCSVRVHGVAGVSETEAQRDITVDGFRRDPTQLNRLRPWLRRELTVLYGAQGSLLNIVQSFIIARLARHGLEDTPTIEEDLRPFLLARTEHFLHELVSFARSPLTMDNYDLEAVYQPLPNAMELDASNGDSANSSVIAISEGEEAEEEAHPNNVIPDGSSLSLSAWDDETPGPSYSTSEALSPAPTEAVNEEGECMIVGYKKPMAERTPELVQLSSDTEGEELQKTEPLSTLPPITTSISTPIKAKDTEGGRACFSGSGSSLCTISPPLPEAKSTRRRRKRKRRGVSGISANPNRCIYPAMMCSPMRSSIESISPLLVSPADSASEYCSSRDSRLTTSSSSPSSSSSSLCSSPQPSLPHTPARTPEEKPGGKRKYKSRHLDRHTDPSWRPRGRKNKRRKRGRSDMSRRSPSVEIVYEGTASSISTRKRHHKTQQHSRPPPIITLDSDSSPPSSQHADDLGHLPPLSLVRMASVGVAAAVDIGELPVDILDEVSDRSEAEPAFHNGNGGDRHSLSNNGRSEEGQPIADTQGLIRELVSKQTETTFCNITDDLSMTSPDAFRGHNKERPPSLNFPDPTSYSSPPPLRRAPPSKDAAPRLVETEDDVSVHFSTGLSVPTVSMTDVFSHLDYLHEGRGVPHGGDFESSSVVPVDSTAAGSDHSVSPAPPSLFDSRCFSSPNSSMTPPTSSAACHVSTTCDL